MHSEPLVKIIDAAVEEATVLEREGFEAIILENMHDVPYLNREVGPEITACMTAVACAVRRAVKIPIGLLPSLSLEDCCPSRAASHRFIVA